MLVYLSGVLIPLLLNRYPPKACVDRKIMDFSELKGTIYEGGHKRGMNTAKPHRNTYKHQTQNNIRKPKTALKLPENSKYRKPLGIVKLQYCNLK